MRNLKKALSVTLALALSLVLAAPAFADGPGWNLGVQGKSAEEVTVPSATVELLSWIDNGDDFTKAEEPRSAEWDNVVRLSAGDTMVLTISKPGTVSIQAWSDPDGDGVYEQWMYEVGGNGENMTYAVLPIDTASPLPSIYNESLERWTYSTRCTLTTSGQLGWTSGQTDAYEKAGDIDSPNEWEDIAVSADYLLQQFCPNTYLNIFAYLREGSYQMRSWHVYLAGDSQPAAPAEPEQPTTPTEPEQPTVPSAPAPTSVILSLQNLAVDGKDVDCEKYNIDGSNYFKLRDLAQLLSGTGSQFEVGYDEASATVSITTGQAYTPNGTELATGVDNSATTQPSSQAILINGEKNEELTVYNIGGSNFFQLRQLGNVLGFEVDYNVDTNTAIVNSVQK